MKHMKTVIIIRQAISILIIIAYLLAMLTAYADGILPGLSETVGISMPSLGEALQRYPDSETVNEDGSTSELFTNVSEADFNTFSAYLESQGATLADYKVENGLLTAEIQVKGSSFRLSYDSRGGEVKVTYPSGTFDEWVKNAKTHCVVAEKLLNEGKYDEAIVVIQEIPQFMDYDLVKNLLKKSEILMASADEIISHEAKLKPFQTIGQIVKYGKYEQDNNIDNGPEEIEWVVMDVQKGKCLLLSKYGLDVKRYNTKQEKITWEDCSLRDWLNNDFIHNAFTVEEQSAILLSEVDNSGYTNSNGGFARGGNNTQDKLFLLSYNEANLFFGITLDFEDSIKAQMPLTNYSLAQGAWSKEDITTEEGEVAGWWWLRSRGYWTNYALIVANLGFVDNMSSVTEDGIAVRPAFWLNLESDIF